jgi:hypothetical protein
MTVEMILGGAFLVTATSAMLIYSRETCIRHDMGYINHFIIHAGVAQCSI